MGRKSGFGGILQAMARDAARRERERIQYLKAQDREMRRQERERIQFNKKQERDARQVERDRVKQAKEDARYEKELAKQERVQYLEDRVHEATDLTESVQEKMSAIARILLDTLDVDDRIDFDSLRLNSPPPELVIPTEIAHPEPEPRLQSFIGKIPAPSAIKSLLPGIKRKHQEALSAGQAQFEAELRAWQQAEGRRKASLEKLKIEHQLALRDFASKKAMRDAEVDEFKERYLAGDVDSIIAYSSMVLERSAYPDGFTRKFEVAYTPDSKMLVVEMQLPEVDFVPAVQEYRYNKARDEIKPMARRAADIHRDYAGLVAAVALRTLHEIFEADTGRHVDVCCFNGYVETIDRSTGKDIKAHLVSVRAAKNEFEQLDLRRVDTALCLRNLGAHVSGNPEDARAVKPLVEFDMVDKRFVAQADVAAQLESAQNLMDLSPTQFEHLVANLFGKLGLESKLTRSSRDGGVDCIAYDARPVLGGKVAIQAKRYRHTVGVSAVRDLYGTMMNEGANKGILVTTSGYGPDAFEFAKDKPIELLDGGGLLYLLRDVGIEARIVMPDE